MDILETLIQLRDDLKLWTKNNLDAKVSKTTKVNGKTLDKDIILSASDVCVGKSGTTVEAAIENISTALSNYYTKIEIDSLEFITVDDIDSICGATIQT